MPRSTRSPDRTSPDPTSSHPTGAPPGGGLGLVEVLELLPAREVRALAGRLGIELDAAKRLDPPNQLARGMIVRSDINEPSAFPAATRELLNQIAANHGVLVVRALPASVEPLVARGLVFAREAEGGIELLLPIAHLLTLAPWEGEDPRGVRALFSGLDSQVAASIASHYLGRSATHPMVLSLESAWRALVDPARLRSELSQLAPMERKLLLAIEALGGEVDTEELLDLEREPMRLRNATGATLSRRGIGFALERRGFLIPVHPNRHLIPTEVSRVIGARRHAKREAERSQIREFVLGEDHAPRRAHFASDPTALVMAMAMLVRESGTQIKHGVGTPRSLLNKFSTRFGCDVETATLLAALSRACGLWGGAATSEASPPGSTELFEVGSLLFQAWQRGGVWDEARPNGEVLRASGDAREPSAVGVIRTVVLEALVELGEGRWVPYKAIEGYLLTDTRIPGVARLIERWAERAGIPALSPSEIARSIVFDTLHTLGVVDLGDVDEDELRTIRITARGRGYLAQQSRRDRFTPSEFSDNHALRFGGDVKVAQVLSLSPFTEVGNVSGQLEVVINSAGVSRALAAGVDPEVIQRRLERIAALPDPIARMLSQASAVLGRGEFVACSGFLWVDDPEVRRMLSSRRQTADLFIDPSPSGGLLLASGVDLDKVTRRARALGVEILVEGELHKASASTSQTRRSPAASAPESTTGRRQSGVRRVGSGASNLGSRARTGGRRR